MNRISVVLIHTKPEYPPLALGMILAYAQTTLSAEEWDLEPRYAANRDEIERVAPSGPLVFLYSNYEWTIEDNLALSRWVKQRYPDAVNIHGGPSTPSYVGATEEFLVANPHVDFAVRGEGEQTAIELLQHIAHEQSPPREVEGLSFLEGGDFVQTPRRKPMPDINIFPSPYLAGVFDDLSADDWEAATLETNRGCPYSCVYCDWGSATRQKVRKFDLERIRGEIDWIAAHRAPWAWIADANFGILRRDVEITQMLCDAKRRTGFPQRLITNYAKNTHANLVQIIEMFVDVGMLARGGISIQTRDEATLKTVRRQNIRNAEYDKLAEVFKRRGLSLTTHLMIGLPGSTVESFKEDLRAHFFLDIEVEVFHTMMLTNSPMADPAYIEEHALEVDEGKCIIASNTFTPEDIWTMNALARLFSLAHAYGIFRQVLSYLHWDHEIDTIDFLHGLLNDMRETTEYPLLSQILDAKTEDSFDIRDIGGAALGLRTYLRETSRWQAFYDELGQYIRQRYPAADDPGLRTALTAQVALMPGVGRSFPDQSLFEHDIVRYILDRRDPEGPRRKLVDYGPGVLDVDDPRRHMSTDQRRTAPSPDTPGGWRLQSQLSRTASSAG